MVCTRRSIATWCSGVRRSLRRLTPSRRMRPNMSWLGIRPEGLCCVLTWMSKARLHSFWLIFLPGLKRQWTSFLSNVLARCRWGELPLSIKRLCGCSFSMSVLFCHPEANKLFKTLHLSLCLTLIIGLIKISLITGINKIKQSNCGTMWLFKPKLILPPSNWTPEILLKEKWVKFLFIRQFNGLYGLLEVWLNTNS